MNIIKLYILFIGSMSCFLFPGQENESRENLSFLSRAIKKQEDQANKALVQAATKDFQPWKQALILDPSRTQKRYEAIETAINEGANINKRFTFSRPIGFVNEEYASSLLEYAARHNDIELLQILLEFPMLDKTDIINGKILHFFLEKKGGCPR